MAYLFPCSFLVILKFETDLIMHTTRLLLPRSLLISVLPSLAFDKQSTSLTIVSKQGGENFDFAVNILRGGRRDQFRINEGWIPVYHRDISSERRDFTRLESDCGREMIKRKILKLLIGK